MIRNIFCLVAGAIIAAATLIITHPAHAQHIHLHSYLNGHQWSCWCGFLW